MTELEKADFGDFKNFEKKLGCGFHGNIIHYKGGIVSFLGHRVWACKVYLVWNYTSRIFFLICVDGGDLRYSTHTFVFHLYSDHICPFVKAIYQYDFIMQWTPLVAPFLP